MGPTIDENWKRIAIIKIGWSKSYDGSDHVEGLYSYLANHQGYEAYNFKRGPDGQFYGYLPPIGRGGLPNPINKDGWLLIFVSVPPIGGGLKVVGWYDSARFLSEYVDRPEYMIDPIFPAPEGKRFHYCLVAQSTFLIPEEQRQDVLPLLNGRLRSSPILYVRDGSSTFQDREVFAEWAESVVHQYKE